MGLCFLSVISVSPCIAGKVVGAVREPPLLRSRPYYAPAPTEITDFRVMGALAGLNWRQ